MTGRRLRKLFLLAAVAAVGYWLYRNPFTVSQFVDRLTAPLLASKAVVEESEHKRVEAEAAPVIEKSQDASVATLRERMTTREVREILGEPDRIEEIRLPEKKVLTRWSYRRVGRVLDFDEGRVVSIAVR